MDNLPVRKRMRLENYDYSQNGYYFVTVCTKDRKSLFWNNEPTQNDCRGGYHPPEKQTFVEYLSDYGKIVNSAIQAISKHYANVKIDKYVIMPDHVHMILILSNEDKCGRIISAPTKSIAIIIGQMKRWVSKNIGASIWQKSYYEHVIRNETEYFETLEYIMNNPLRRELRKTEQRGLTWIICPYVNECALKITIIRKTDIIS